MSTVFVPILPCQSNWASSSSELSKWSMEAFGMRESFYFSGNVKTFSCLVGGLKQHSREYCILEKEFHPQNITTSPMGIQHSHGKGMFAIVKRPKYLYHHPKPPAIDHHRPPPPPLAALHRRRRWPLATLCRHRPVTCHHLPQGYFWKFVNYSQEFNLHTKHS